MEYRPVTNTNQNINSNIPASKKLELSFDFKRYIAVVLGYWYWILLSVLIALTIAFLYIQVTQPVYAIKSALVVHEDENSSGEILDKLNLVKKTPVNFFNEMNAIHSEDLVTQTVDSLNLHINYFIKGKLHD